MIRSGSRRKREDGARRAMRADAALLQQFHFVRPILPEAGLDIRPRCPRYFTTWRTQGSRGEEKEAMTSLTLVRRIKARPSIVFEALTTPKGIASWWGPDAGPVLLAETDARDGGRFRVRFRMLDGSEHESTGEY